MYLMFLGPYQEGGDFRDTGITGIRRFLERVWRYVTDTEFADEPVNDPALLRLIHQKIRKVTDDVAGLHYNTAIAALMELLNGLVSREKHYRQCAKTLLQLLCPFAPFIAHELWERVGGEGMAGDASWSEHDPNLIVEDTVEFVIQVNGRLRDRIVLPTDTPQTEVERAAFDSPTVQKWTEGKEVARTVFVPNKLLNVVVTGAIEN